MDFADRIKAHAKRVMENKDDTVTEAATKQALIVPFFRLLGYDPDDPKVVIPEYCADFGEKRECKVDYAIRRSNDIVIIVEAKKVGDQLDGAKEAQLQQYFQSLLPVKIGILTDGVVYKFFTDLDHPNVMDKKPFMTFDFSAVDEGLIPELKKLCNDCFDLDTALHSAQELKYLGQLKKVVAEEMTAPSDDLARLLAKRVYDGVLTAKVLDEFKGRVKLAFDNYIREVINARLEGGKVPLVAYPTGQEEQESTNESSAEDIQDNRIVTTQEEIEGYHIVKSILRESVDPERIILSDGVNYCSVVLDSRKKVLCRMHFNSQKKKIFETLNMAMMVSTRHEIESLNDIYKHAEALKATAVAIDAKYKPSGKDSGKAEQNA